MSQMKRERWKLLASVARFLQNKSGNSMVLVTAALVPIAGVIGGGIDIGRAYLAKSKLQAACDAGALAGRRSMSGTTWTATARSNAEAYFNVNFVNGKFGTTGLTKSFTAPDNETVRGVASVNVPTTLMRIFGSQNVPVSVNCEAVMNLPNTDVMFVLDTTGSMDETNAGDTNPKIVGLRGALTGFYNSVEAAKSTGTQVRYGFVPYSSTVNVGYLLQPDWMVNRWTYQSRAPSTGTGAMAWTNSNWSLISAPSTVSRVRSALPSEPCTVPAGNTNTVNWGNTINLTDTPGPPRVVRIRRTLNGMNYYTERVGSACELVTETYTNYVEEYDATLAAASAYDYRPVEYDVSALRGITTGGTITAPLNNNNSARTIQWKGCIEERDTARAVSYSVDSRGNISPAGALDMNIDLVPTPGVASTQWRPFLPQLVFSRENTIDISDSSLWNINPVNNTTAPYLNLNDYQSGDFSVCPSESRRLAPITATELSSYLASLAPRGGTYHDIGLIWGARLLSPTGLFASANATTPSGETIDRHLVFMTDGATDTRPEVYDAYGFPALDRRRVLTTGAIPTKADQDTLVIARTEALCTAIKAKGITIWTIAFGTSMTPLLENCASAPTNAFQANNSVALNTAFSDIAAKIANLRLKR